MLPMSGMGISKPMLGEVYPEYIARINYKYKDYFWNLIGKIAKEHRSETDQQKVEMLVQALTEKADAHRSMMETGAVINSALCATATQIYLDRRMHPSFYSFALSAELAVRILSRGRGSWTDLAPLEAQSGVLNMVFNWAMWDLNGRHVYEVEPELARQLCPDRTSLRGLTGDDLRAPFPALYINIPKGVININDQTSGQHPAVGVMVVEDHHWIDSDDLKKSCGDNPSLGSIENILKTHGKSRAWHIQICGQSKNPDNYLDDAQIYYTVNLVPGRSVEDCVDDVVEYWSRRNIPHDTPASSLRDTFMYVMNVVTYATNVDGASKLGIPLVVSDLQKRVKTCGRDRRKKLRRELEDAWKGRRIILRNLETDRTEPHLGSDDADAVTGHTLSVRTLVTGHWRKQACGPQRSERRLTWIRPFWRGPDGAPWVHHPRRVLEAKALVKQAGATC